MCLRACMYVVISICSIYNVYIEIRRSGERVTVRKKLRMKVVYKPLRIHGQ